jgi:hypothetical protein
LIPDNNTYRPGNTIKNNPVRETDYDEFRGIDWCEVCRRETCICPRYVESQRGTVLWMHEDIGAMMIFIDSDIRPWELTGQCYHDVDPESGMDYVYQLTEYMTGPPHGCIFRVKRIGDRHMLTDKKHHGGFRKPRINVDIRHGPGATGRF